MLLYLDHPRRNLVAVGILALIWIWTLSGLGPQSYVSPKTQALIKGDWTASAVETSFDPDSQEFNGSAIWALCDAQKVWVDDVVFKAHDNQGGIGNVRQEILSAIRYAIDAGAGFVIPTINVRGDDLTTLNSGTEKGMDYMFDREEFIRRLKLSCPQMRLYESIDEVRSRGAIVEERIIAPRDMDQINGTVLSVNPEITRARAPLGQITLVIFLITIQYYPVCNDSEDFANTFGHLLPFRRDILHLASLILQTMTTRFSLPISPSTQRAPYPNAYLGVHLRTSADAIAAGWTSYETQSTRYLSLASSPATRLPVIYVASGNVTSISSLAVSAAKLSPPIPVVTKENLLSGDDLTRLHALSWDQQALVDYIMLLKSSYFVGLVESSFSGNIAMARRVVNGRGTCGGREEGWADPWVEELPGEGTRGWPPETAYKDHLSELMGPGPSGWETKMWP